ncbi:hypothetical protein BC628DRAFT_1309963 [Trametes gibbosa]|nr:hypothetical protein BC628DRAFT_1309963 [Trametes gibbosa]
MEYRPRYTQPFTLEEARLLAVPIITEEISRLQNSLSHLQRTQDELREALATSPGDTDLKQAFTENEDVIGSQKERITMLRMVLDEKGLPMSAHYDLQVGNQPSNARDPTLSQPRSNGIHPHESMSDQTTPLEDTSSENEDDQGVYL